MAQSKTREELLSHKLHTLSSIEQYLDSLISSSNPKRQGKADKLSYWLEDYIKFLNFEDNFSPSSLKRYKRGEVIKVHLGYNIGSEEGGLHYAIVLDKENSIHSPVVTIVPLTSLKPNKHPDRLRKGEIFLGTELFDKLAEKSSIHLDEVTLKLKELKSAMEHLLSNTPPDSNVMQDLLNKKDHLNEEVDFIRKMQSEIEKMKIGSIALVNQITTISKIRIYDPKTNHDVLSGIRFSAEKLDLIDAELTKLFTK